MTMDEVVNVYRVLQKGTAKLSGNIPHTHRKKICYVDMCPETLNFHVRAHFITSLQITLIIEWKHTATERTSVTSNTLLQEMFKMSSISEDTCIHPPSHGIPDALMQPWRMAYCIPAVHKTSTKSLYIWYRGCVDKSFQMPP